MKRRGRKTRQQIITGPTFTYVLGLLLAHARALGRNPDSGSAPLFHK